MSNTIYDDKSKTLKGTDKSAHEFLSEILDGQPSLSIEFDRIQRDNQKGGIAIVHHVTADGDPHEADIPRLLDTTELRRVMSFAGSAHIDGQESNVYVTVTAPGYENAVAFHLQGYDMRGAQGVEHRCSKGKLSAWFQELNDRGGSRKTHDAEARSFVSDPVWYDVEAEPPKALGEFDENAARLSMTLLKGNPTKAINFDGLYENPGSLLDFTSGQLGLPKVSYNAGTKRWVIIEYLKCSSDQDKKGMDPTKSTPNNYWGKNSRKFVALWNCAKAMDADLLLINYADRGTLHEDKSRALLVTGIDESLHRPLQHVDLGITTRDQITQLVRHIETYNAQALADRQRLMTADRRRAIEKHNRLDLGQGGDGRGKEQSRASKGVTR